ncbi:MAG: recombination protein RecR [Deltaproteobacteria bacterium]|nr:recombination protein RecR [Deltaproteobacteria bacterium]
MLPDAVARLIRQLARLPGVGEKTATRLAFFLLNDRGSLAEELGECLLDVRRQVHPCRRCGHLTEGEICAFCESPRREQGVLCVVEGPAELLALERCGAFAGRYHVLGGLLSPLHGIGPAALRLEELTSRVAGEQIVEVILALPPSVDGEATALYIHHGLRPLGVRCTRLAQGLPMGGELQHADEGTLARAVQYRRDMESEETSGQYLIGLREECIVTR